MKKKLLPVLVIIRLIFCFGTPFFPEGISRNIKPEITKHNMIPPIQGHSGIEIFTFENENDKLVKHYLKKYRNPRNLKWIRKVLERGKQYLYFINQRIIHYGLPLELRFLPVIESGYISSAVSRSEAVGIWQFMRNSTGNSMDINDWVDERRDFWKSTDAALKKLKYNYSVTGDWLLALAAYNCGLGRITRLIKKTGIDNFWKLAKAGLLPEQTLHYVPKFLAISRICLHPGRNGLPVSWDDPVVWDRIKLDRPIDLTLLSRESGVPLEILKSGNRELHHNITPPAGRGYYLKIPAQYKDIISSTLENKDFKLIRFHVHTVHSGDTLYAISRCYGVPVKLIYRYNPGINPNCLSIGKKLMIPAFKNIKAPGEDKKEYSLAGYHIVKKGDTLWEISQRYKTTPEIISRLNNISINSIMRVGSKLKIPGEEKK